MTEQDLKKRLKSLEGLAAAGFAVDHFGDGGKKAGIEYLFKPSANGDGQEILRELAENSSQENDGQSIVDAEDNLKIVGQSYLKTLSEMSVKDFAEYIGVKKIEESHISKEDMSKTFEDLSENKEAISLFGAYSKLKLQEDTGKAIAKSSEGVGKNLSSILSQMDKNTFKDVESKIPEDKKKIAEERRKVQLKILEGASIRDLYAASTMGNQYGEAGKEAASSNFFSNKWGADFVNNVYLAGVDEAMSGGKSSFNLTRHSKQVYESAAMSVKVKDLLDELGVKDSGLTDSQKGLYMYELQESDSKLSGAIIGTYMEKVKASSVGNAIVYDQKRKREQYDEHFSRPKESREELAAAA